MWYVIQVQGGQEEKTAELIKKQLTFQDSCLRECFIPRKIRVKKFKGRWQQVEEILFSGYVFADSEDAEELYRRLKQVGRLTKVLQDGSFLFLPLSKTEELWIKGIGDNRHVTRLSKIEIRTGNKRWKENGQDRRFRNSETAGGNFANKNGVEETEKIEAGKHVIVREGPLKGLEGHIVNVNLHKREVTVQMPFAGRMVDVRLGVEVVG